MQTKVRGTKSVADVEVDLKATEGGSLITVDQRLVWTAKGYGWKAITTTGVAGLVVRPSTVPLMCMYNGEAGGGKVYVVEQAFAFNLVAAAAADYALWACVHPVGTTASASVITAAMIRSTRGIAAYGGNALIDDDTAVLDKGWFPISEAFHTVTVTTPGGSLIAEIGGRIIVPPTAAISLQVVGTVNTQTFTVGLHWFEVPQSELGLG